MKLCGFEIGLNQPLFLIAGPCVVESEQLQLDVAGKLKEITGKVLAHVQPQINAADAANVKAAANEVAGVMALGTRCVANHISTSSRPAK